MIKRWVRIYISWVMQLVIPLLRRHWIFKRLILNMGSRHPRLMIFVRKLLTLSTSPLPLAPVIPMLRNTTHRQIYRYGSRMLTVRKKTRLWVKTGQTIKSLQQRRLRLAFVTLLPPVQNKITEFNAKLIQDLAQYYDITVITPQEKINSFCLKGIRAIRTPLWLQNNFYQMDRIVYHFGNSPLYQYAFELMGDIPGVAIVNNFFLNNLYVEPSALLNQLYHAHGYIALMQQTQTDYPANLRMLQNAIGIIVSSPSCSQQLAVCGYTQAPFCVTLEDGNSGPHYAEKIEYFHSFVSGHPGVFIQQKLSHLKTLPNQQQLVDLVASIADQKPFFQGNRQLLLDISAIHNRDNKTGIQRIVRSLVLELLQVAYPHYRVEPVYLKYESGRWCYKYARQYTLNLLNCRIDFLQNDEVEVHPDDILFVIDLAMTDLVAAMNSGVHARWQSMGVKIYSIVYDLLPIRLSEMFPLGTKEKFFNWLVAISQLDGAICISKYVADDLTAWREENISAYMAKKYQISWCHQGADIESSGPTYGFPENASEILQQISNRLTFLMVGTIEPRKGYSQTIETFLLLWSQGFDLNLVIVGRKGWEDAPTSRSNVSQVLNLLRHHPEVGRRLFWLPEISDEYLQKIYSVSSVLIAASLGEGFGLPLIEAARHHLPIIARDIPIFREVTQGHAYFFTGEDAANLAEAIKQWLILYRTGTHPQTHEMSWYTWKDCAKKIMTILMAAD